MVFGRIPASSLFNSTAKLRHSRVEQDDSGPRPSTTSTSTMAVSMLNTPSRGSTSSQGSSFVPVTRQNTMSSQEGSRSMRASKRYSVTALYLSMNGQRDLEIEDDLARGTQHVDTLQVSARPH